MEGVGLGSWLYVYDVASGQVLLCMQPFQDYSKVFVIKQMYFAHLSCDVLILASEHELRLCT